MVDQSINSCGCVKYQEMTGKTKEEREKRFLADLMLMRLARWLRLMGQDVACPEGERDEDLLRQAAKEGRTLITRDRRLYQSCRKAGISCQLICSSDIWDQLREMAKAGVALNLDPRRCTVCNGLLEETVSPQGQSWQCQVCRKLYWQGGHWKGMREILDGLLDE